MGFTKRQIKFAFYRYVALPPAMLILRLLVRTWRLSPELDAQLVQVAKEDRVIAAAGHGTLFALITAGRRMRQLDRVPVVLSSPSRDGVLLERALGYLGFLVVKGSSRSRAVAGARGMVDSIEAGHPVLITVDGPRGPRLVPKPGILGVGRLGAANVYTASFSADKYWRFRSWDGLFLPKPWATIDGRITGFDMIEGESESDSVKRLESQLRNEAASVSSPILEQP